MFDFGKLFYYETPDERLEFVKGMPVNNTDDLAELIAILMHNLADEEGLLVGARLADKPATQVSYCWQLAYQLEKLGVVKYG